MCQNDGAFFYVSRFGVSILHHRDMACPYPLIIGRAQGYAPTGQPVCNYIWRQPIKRSATSCSYQKLYTKFISSWLGGVCRVELLYCCRSNTGQNTVLILSQLSYISECSDCTSMCLIQKRLTLKAKIKVNLDKAITRNKNNKRVDDPNNNNNEKKDFTTNGNILFRSASLCTNWHQYRGANGSFSYRCLR